MRTASLPWLGSVWARLTAAHEPDEVRAYRALCGGPPARDATAIADWLRQLAADGGADRLPVYANVEQLSGWLADLWAACPAPGRPRRRVLMFSSLAHWNAMCLPVAIALAPRVAVDFYFLPYRDHRAPDPGTDSDADIVRPALCRAVPAVTLHPRLRLINLLDLDPAPVPAELLDAADRDAEMDFCHATFREEVPAELSAADRRLLAHRAARNRDAAGRVRAAVRAGRYHSALIPNGAIYEFAPAYQVCRAAGLPVVTWECHEQKFRLNLGDRIPCALTDTDALWAADAPHVLPPERRARVTARLMGREAPGWAAAGYVWDGQPTAVAAADELVAGLGLDPAKPTALMLTNLAWDSAVLGQTRTFRSMAEWIERTVRWFAARPDWQLVVRVHPVEASVPNNQPVAGLLRDRLPDLPAHVRVVGPSEKVNTYGLMRLCRFGLVYATTAGLEMAARGVPVVVAGRVHYADRGFTLHADTPAGYFALLDRLLADPAGFRPSPRQVDLALCYADMYFERFPRPFPWWDMSCHTKFGTETPMAQVLAGDCEPGSAHTLDVLAGLARCG